MGTPEPTTLPIHVPHCGAIKDRFVCNRDAGHQGYHESRSDGGPGCVGWRNGLVPTAERVALDVKQVRADQHIYDIDHMSEEDD